MEYSEEIKSTISDLLGMLAISAEIDISYERDMYNAHIKTDEDASLLIGKHAHMLASLQRVVSAILYQKIGEKIELVIDVNDYRSAQKERLAGIADNIARRVIDEQRDARLSSFSSYERRIIHEHIAENYHSLESFSEDDGPRRRLVISLKK